jgi:hypothetical protein
MEFRFKMGLKQQTSQLVGADSRAMELTKELGMIMVLAATNGYVFD